MQSDDSAPIRTLEADTGERILEAACYEFSRSGFSGTTMRQIAERADVGHPLINYYFNDKDGLWRAAAERLYGRVGRILDETLAQTTSLDDASRIRTILVEFIMVASESRLLTFLIETSEEGGERAAWLWNEWVEPVRDRIHAIISDGQALGLIVKKDPDLVYQILTGFSMADSAHALFPGEERPPGERLKRVEEFVSFLMLGQ